MASCRLADQSSAKRTRKTAATPSSWLSCLGWYPQLINLSNVDVSYFSSPPSDCKNSKKFEEIRRNCLIKETGDRRFEWGWESDVYDRGWVVFHFHLDLHQCASIAHTMVEGYVPINQSSINHQSIINPGVEGWRGGYLSYAICYVLRVRSTSIINQTSLISKVTRLNERWCFAMIGIYL